MHWVKSDSDLLFAIFASVIQSSSVRIRRSRTVPAIIHRLHFYVRLILSFLQNKDITLIRNEIEAEGNDLRYIRTTDQATIRDKESFLNLLTTEGPLRKKGRTILSFDDITDGDSIECGGSRQVKLERTVQILNKSKMNMENSFELQVISTFYTIYLQHKRLILLHCTTPARV